MRTNSLLYTGMLTKSLVVSFLFICFGQTLLAEIARPNLFGTVLDESDKPVPNATVFIYTAGPKDGAGILCPSCYADCRKRATSNANGKFLIESLDPELLFRVLVVGKDQQPKFVGKVDPAEAPLTVKLKPRRGGESKEQRLEGRVVDSEKKPISGAVINIRGVTRDERTQFGGNPNVDPIAVSDDSGQFVINSTEPFDAAGVDVEARGFAKRIFSRLATDGTVHELNLTEGTTLKGRVMSEGKPLAGVEIGVAGAVRNSEIFAGDYSVATDNDGRFLFSNLPPRTQFYVYGIAKSLKGKGCIPAQSTKTGDDGSTQDIGDISVQPGFVLEGKSVLTDEKPLPAKLRVVLGREQAWDPLETLVKKDGSFRFTDLPPESVSLSARVKGYHLSLRNASLDPYNASLIGRIFTNKTDLIVEFAPGAEREQGDGDQSTLREEPLRGAEKTANPVGDIKVIGTVVDAETKNPLPTFAVVEGRNNEFGNQIDWLSSRRTEYTNGAFTHYFTKQRRAPAVMIEAAGYLPMASDVITTNETNFVFEMKRGTGFKGTVLKPDGAPATNVAVYLTDMKNSVYVGDELKVREELFRGTKKTHTDASGHFSFPPQIDAYAIIILDESGYAEVLVGELEKNPEVHLQPYGRVEGKLMIGSRAGKGEKIRLGLAHIPYAHHPRHFAPLSFYLGTKTDDEGKFVFERVPPIALQAAWEPKVRDARQGTIPEAQTTKFQAEPGETNQLSLGGKGRPAIGRVVVKGYDEKIDYRADVYNLESVRPQPVGLPDLMGINKEFTKEMSALETQEEKTAAMERYKIRQQTQTEKTREFYKTPAGRTYAFSSRRDALNFSQDGSFRVEDIPGGKYRLQITLREGGGDSFSRFNAPVIAQLNEEFEVPDSPNGRTDEPHDLGELVMEARAVMKAGKSAPDFEVKTLDGATLKLSDYKGKYLLLDFWAVWCGPCVAETPNLKAVWDEFKDNPRFAMLGMSLDPSEAAPRDYAKKNKLGWTQGFLGEWSETKIPERFGVQGIPAIFLIDPDGKIVASGLRGEQMKAAVHAAMDKK